MQDAWRAYLELALGVTEASRKKAAQVIRSVAEQSGAKVEDMQGMAEDLLNTGMANRESLTKLVRFELDRALGKVGLATTEEVDDLKEKVRDLELKLREARENAASAEQPAATTPSADVADRPVAKKAVKKSTAKKVAKKSTAKKSTSKTAAKKSSTKAAVKKTATKTTAKKTATKKAAAKKTVAKKSTTKATEKSGDDS